MSEYVVKKYKITLGTEKFHRVVQKFHSTEMDEESASLLPRGDASSPASPVVNSSSSVRNRIIFLVVATAAVTVGVLAYVDASSRKTTGLSGHKMMLIKTGLMGYSQLHDDEVSELFHNF